MNKKYIDESIEQIENDFWPDYDYETNLIRKCHELRKKKINDLTIENMRMLLGQNIGNNILIPIALEILSKNILSEGNFYEGDLLNNVLTSDKKYWVNNPDQKSKLIQIIEDNKLIIDNMDSTKEIKDSINDAVQEFKKK